MKTIKNKVTNELIINKSRFITVLYPIFKEDDVKLKIENIKKEYRDATHYCYAYIIGSKEKCSDDKEPSGTAGRPILNVLKNNDITNILCIVIRYFGGIKLGSGGLIRAYSSSVNNALKICEFGILDKGYEITIEFDYDNIKMVDYILKDIPCNKTFDKKIVYQFSISNNNYNVIENLERYSKIINKKETDIIKSGN